VKVLKREFLDREIGALKAKIETETDEEQKRILMSKLTERMQRKKKIR